MWNQSLAHSRTQHQKLKHPAELEHLGHLAQTLTAHGQHLLATVVAMNQMSCSLLATLS
jgi:hypothetical protein